MTKSSTRVKAQPSGQRPKLEDARTRGDEAGAYRCGAAGWAVKDSADVGNGLSRELRRKPLLIIVTGAPATGKTTLGSRLGNAMQLPVLSKDLIKEALMDSLPVASLDESQRMGRASFSALAAVAAALLKTGTDLILEAPFSQPVGEESLRQLVRQSSAVLVVCSAPTELVLTRYRHRTSGGARHVGHMDQVRDDAEAVANFVAPELGVPTLVVQTTDGYNPSFEEVVQWITAGLRPPER